MQSVRRQLLRSVSAGLAGVVLSPRLRSTIAPRRAPATKPKTFTSAECEALDALAETLLAGAQQAGFTAYIDTQLSLPLERQSLMIKYLGIAPPFADFYRTGLASLDVLAAQRETARFSKLEPTARTDLIAQLGNGSVTAWRGPPAGLFYFVVRNDAVDVVYGTRRGFAHLGVPYMAHIEPVTDWPT